jgi:hypothetical protein
VIECPRCNNLNPPDATRCSSCGAGLVVTESEPEIVAESPAASEPERESDEDLYPETVAEEPPLSGEPVTPEQGQAVIPPPSPPPPRRDGAPWPAIIALAILLVALAIAAGIVAKSLSHHHHRRLAIALASPAPTTYLTPPPAPRPAPTPRARALTIHKRLLVVNAASPAPVRTSTPAPVPTSTPAPAKTATPAPAPTVASAVTIDSFTVVRSLKRRVCLGFRVEHATYVSITNARTEEVVYTRDLSGQAVAENPQPCVFVKRRGVKGAIGFELVASGHNSQTSKYLSAPPF